MSEMDVKHPFMYIIRSHQNSDYWLVRVRLPPLLEVIDHI